MEDTLLPEGHIVNDEDLQYFRNKLLEGLRKGRSAASLKKTFNQLEAYEDAIVIYRLTQGKREE